VLRDENGPDFTAVAAHVNLWALPGFPRTRLLFDVGLQLSVVGDVQLTRLRLAIPFETSPGNLKNLSPRLLVQPTAELIFGGPVTIGQDHGHRTLNWDGSTLRLVDVSEHDSKIDDGKTSAAFSLWNLRLMQAVTSGQHGYLRCRFVIDQPGRSWIWRSSVLRYGAVVDLR